MLVIIQCNNSNMTTKMAAKITYVKVCSYIKMRSRSVRTDRTMTMTKGLLCTDRSVFLILIQHTIQLLRRLRLKDVQYDIQLAILEHSVHADSL